MYCFPIYAIEEGVTFYIYGVIGENEVTKKVLASPRFWRGSALAL